MLFRSLYGITQLRNTHCQNKPWGLEAAPHRSPRRCAVLSSLPFPSGRFPCQLANGHFQIAHTDVLRCARGSHTSAYVKGSATSRPTNQYDPLPTSRMAACCFSSGFCSPACPLPLVVQRGTTHTTHHIVYTQILLHPS